jgi:hypothetical protein
MDDEALNDTSVLPDPIAKRTKPNRAATSLVDPYLPCRRRLLNHIVGALEQCERK